MKILADNTLVVDIGNTHTVVGVGRDVDTIATFRIQTDRHALSDEIYLDLERSLARKNIKLTDIKRAIVGSVVPELDLEWKRLLEDIGCPCLLANAKSPWSFRIALPSPHQVGADRLANAEAATHLLMASSTGLSSALVIDAGTATTIDIIERQATGYEYIGGVIIPGVSTSLSSLIDRASRLRSLSLRDVTNDLKVIGNGTEAALLSGVAHGFCAQMDGMVERIRAERPSLARSLVIATGGWAHLLSLSARHIDTFDETFTLKGLLQMGIQFDDQLDTPKSGGGLST